MKLDDDFQEALKDALALNDIAWLKLNESKFDVNHRFSDSDNDTLLSYAISDAGSNVYQYLLQKGADVFTTNDEGETIFHSIVYSGAPERFDIVLRFCPDAIKLLNSRTNEGTTPLLLASLLEKYSVCHHLLDLGADVNMVDNENNVPIHPVCFSGNLDIVKLLVEHGANLHIKTDKGNLPLALAINGGHEHVAKYLLSLSNIMVTHKTN